MSSIENCYKIQNIDLSSKFKLLNGNKTYWSKTAISDTWSGISMSADGTKIAAFVNSDTINTKMYISNDSGKSLNQTANNYNLSGKFSSTVSGNGQTIVFAVNNIVLVSTNSGLDWSFQIVDSMVQSYPISITSSSTGQYLAVCYYHIYNNTYIYCSNDFGLTWTKNANTLLNGWSCITSSSNGMKIAACAKNNYIYYSSNAGNTWVQINNNSKQWSSISMSSDGSKIIACAENDYIYMYMGSTWSQLTNVGSKNWKSVSMSNDGTQIIVCAENDYIYISFDLGITWIQQTSIGQKPWFKTAISSDGYNMYSIVSNEDYIYKIYCPSLLKKTGYKINDVDLNELFYPYDYGDKTDDTGFKINSTDLCNIFKPKLINLSFNIYIISSHNLLVNQYNINNYSVYKFNLNDLQYQATGSIQMSKNTRIGIILISAGGCGGSNNNFYNYAGGGGGGGNLFKYDIDVLSTNIYTIQIGTGSRFLPYDNLKMTKFTGGDISFNIIGGGIGNQSTKTSNGSGGLSINGGNGGNGGNIYNITRGYNGSYVNYITEYGEKINIGGGGSGGNTTNQPNLGGSNGYGSSSTNQNGIGYGAGGAGSNGNNINEGNGGPGLIIIYCKDN